MPEYTAVNLAMQVEGMRNAQKLFFSLIKKAKSTKHPDTFADAKKVLKISQDLEIMVDDTINQILRPESAGESEK